MEIDSQFDKFINRVQDATNNPKLEKIHGLLKVIQEAKSKAQKSGDAKLGRHMKKLGKKDMPGQGNLSGEYKKGDEKKTEKKSGKGESKGKPKKDVNDDAGGSIDGPNKAAGKRFWSYKSDKKGERKHPGPRPPEQAGKTKGKVDGDMKGRFERYYGKSGGKGKGKKLPANVIRFIVARKIANGTQNKSGLAKGRGRKGKK